MGSSRVVQREEKAEQHEGKARSIQRRVMSNNQS